MVGLGGGLASSWRSEGGAVEWLHGPANRLWRRGLIPAGAGLAALAVVLLVLATFLAAAARYFTTLVAACFPAEVGAPAYAAHEGLPYRPSPGGRLAKAD